MANASIRYGASLRKRQRDIREQKRSRYICDMCGKKSVRRIGTGMWKCMSCGATYAGGAYSFKTEAGEILRRALSSIKVE
ncbi:MAG: hypothetical protein QXL16_01710 [Candidatus Micrarchaeaceae archaeon]